MSVGTVSAGLVFLPVFGDLASVGAFLEAIFTEAIVERRPIRVFNHGNLWRDFTYIDDIVAATVKVLDHPPQGLQPPHRIYNVGHNKPENLGRFIDILEDLIGIPAIRRDEPMQPGDVEQTYADISRLQKDFGFAPAVSLEDGLKSFVGWYRDFILGEGGKR